MKANLNIKEDGYVQKTTWKRIGPGGGGAQFFPTVSPHDPDTALVACDMTCTFITHNGGKTWEQINFGRSAVYTIAFDHTQPGIIYTGSKALFRSDDNGVNWKLLFPKPSSDIREEIFPFHDSEVSYFMNRDEAAYHLVSDDGWPGGFVKAIGLDPANPELIVFSVITDRLVIMMSYNKGNTWFKLCSLEKQQCHKLCIDPSSPIDKRRIFIFGSNGIYSISIGDPTPQEVVAPSASGDIKHAGCSIDKATGTPVFFIITPCKWEDESFISGIYRSMDYGATWKVVGENLSEGLTYEKSKITRNFSLLAPCEYDAKVLYLSVENYLKASGDGKETINYYGIMKSEDMGNSWKWVLHMCNSINPPNKEISWIDKFYGPEWGIQPWGMGVSPVNPDICYASDLGITYRTLNGGQSWQQLYSDEHEDGTYSTRGLDVITCFGVHFDPFNQEHLAISYTDIGLFHSFNGGKSWRQALDGVPPKWINSCYWLVYDPEIKGRAWSVWSDAHDLPRIKMQLFGKRGTFAQNKMDASVGGVCKSNDSLQSWIISNAGLPENSMCTHIVLEPDSSPGCRTLYVSVYDKGVYKSVDDGNSWFPVNKGLGENLCAWRLVCIPDGTLYLLITHKYEEGRMISGSIYKSVDRAKTWTEANMPDGIGFVNDLVFNPKNPDIMYATCWPDINSEVPVNGGIYKTLDGGRQWVKVFDRDMYIYGLAVDDNNPSTIYAVSFDSRAYRSDDEGNSWKRLDGYVFKWGHRPILDPYNKDMLYITTAGSSVCYGPAE